MALISKPDYTYIWASGGAIVEPSDVKKQTGWIAEVPPHQWENWAQNRQDQYIAHVNQRGIPEWDALTEYEAAGLSYVQGTNGTVYQSVAASGPSTTTQDPTTDVSDTYWTVAFASNNVATETTAGVVELATSAETITGTDNTRAVHPAGLASLTSTELRSGLVELATSAETVTGTDTVRATHPAGVLAALTAFLPKRVFAATDFIRIPDVPGGLIIQWGTVTTNASGLATITFPIAFPTAAHILQLQDLGTTVATADVWSGSIISTTQANVASANNAGAAQALTAYYLVLGY